jgi:hypothetical protein
MSALERMLAAIEARPAGSGNDAANGPALGDGAPAAAAAGLRMLGLPTRNHEDWRYANLAALESVRDFAAAPAGAHELPEPLPGHARLLLLDGKPAPGLGLPEGLRVVPHAATHPDEPAAGLLRFGLLAQALAPAPLALEFSGAGAIELLLATTPGTACYSAIELRLAPGARLQLAERHVGGTGEQGLACHALQIALGAGATLRHQRLLALSGSGLQLDTLSATLGEAADYQQRCMVAGAGTVRSSQSLRLAGRGAQLDW